MTLHNIGGALPSGMLFRTDRRRQMAAFDALSPELRDIMREAPINVAAEPALQLQCSIGAAATAQLLRQRRADLFPGYRPV